MKLEVLQENLNKALVSASRFVSPKAQLPVLGNILLKATKTKLIVASTNLEISVASSIGAQVKEEGEITVPARSITEIVANLLPGSMSISSEKEQLKIESQSSTLVLSGMNSADFPSVPQKIEVARAVPFPKEPFLNALGQVLFSTSIDETRPVLTGALMIFASGKLTLVATDGFRLSQKKISLPGKLNSRVIIPKTALIECLRLAPEEQEILFDYKEKENQIVFGFSDTVLSSRVLEGDFPDFEKIMPKQSSLSLELDKEDFLRAVKLASVFARDSANIVKLSIGKNSVEVLAESSQAGNQKTQVEAKTEGPGLEIAFNYRFLEELLHAIKGETLRVELSSPGSPGVFKDASDPDFIHLIMPVRVQS
ncbi:MAG TPA: DNA polymerase III subunit beta [Patescibacteria group bacterium]|uniref:Beta sliding clamp n=1 Tax=Candidatus Woesebacteria bacterium RBG_13_46_13 TaxID=1802479 RepID=A0A1F7X5B9_9BACT|nr:MAG: DNA polymerase III subunit beta [Candidatus Woesebacteria bacterium RBG_13_46_13]HJX59337.1 DNA polymerase III subunit beta [Patescibacteria group bacterium]